MIEEQTESSAKSNAPEATNVSILKLLKKINQLLNENNYLRLRNKELEKIYADNNSFLKELPIKNAAHKKAQELVADAQTRLDRLDRKETKIKN